MKFDARINVGLNLFDWHFLFVHLTPSCNKRYLNDFNNGCDKITWYRTCMFGSPCKRKPTLSLRSELPKGNGNANCQFTLPRGNLGSCWFKSKGNVIFYEGLTFRDKDPWATKGASIILNSSRPYLNKAKWDKLIENHHDCQLTSQRMNCLLCGLMSRWGCLARRWSEKSLLYYKIVGHGR